MGLGVTPLAIAHNTSTASEMAEYPEMKGRSCFYKRK
jgi:hypothetical protein